MTKPNKNPEASMDEILASIRRIISDSPADAGAPQSQRVQGGADYARGAGYPAPEHAVHAPGNGAMELNGAYDDASYDDASYDSGSDPYFDAPASQQDAHHTYPASEVDEFADDVARMLNGADQQAAIDENDYAGAVYAAEDNDEPVVDLAEPPYQPHLAPHAQPAPQAYAEQDRRVQSPSREMPQYLVPQASTQQVEPQPYAPPARAAYRDILAQPLGGGVGSAANGHHAGDGSPQPVVQSRRDYRAELEAQRQPDLRQRPLPEPHMPIAAARAPMPARTADPSPLAAPIQRAAPAAAGEQTVMRLPDPHPATGPISGRPFDLAPRQSEPVAAPSAPPLAVSAEAAPSMTPPNGAGRPTLTPAQVQTPAPTSAPTSALPPMTYGTQHPQAPTETAEIYELNAAAVASGASSFAVAADALDNSYDDEPLTLEEPGQTPWNLAELAAVASPPQASAPAGAEIPAPAVSPPLAAVLPVGDAPARQAEALQAAAAPLAATAPMPAPAPVSVPVSVPLPVPAAVEVAQPAVAAVSPVSVPPAAPAAAPSPTVLSPLAPSAAASGPVAESGPVEVRSAPAAAQAMPLAAAPASAEPAAERATVSAAAERATAEFAATVAAVGNGPLPGRCLEDMVADLLRPMLREWLDVNMPRMIERVLAEQERDRNR